MYLDHYPFTSSSWRISGLLVGTILLTLTGTCFYWFAVTPEDRVMTGRQMPSEYTSRIRALDILHPDERIEFFYSDGWWNIEEGFYLLTDQRVVIYARDAEDPAILVPFDQIADIEAEFASDWASNTWITLTLTNATYVSFPASTEAGGDRLMYDALKKRWDAAQALSLPDDPIDDTDEANHQSFAAGGHRAKRRWRGWGRNVLRNSAADDERCIHGVR